MGEYTLNDILNFYNGKAIKSSGGEYPVYGSNGIIGYSNKYLYEKAIIIGRAGSSGSVYTYDDKFWASDNTIVVNTKEGFDLKYCYYLLLTMELNKYACGSAQPLLTQKILKKLKANVPSLSEQKRIASVLSSYDDLIEVNNRRIALLEESARELYKEWFVRFRFPGYKQTKFEKGLPEGWKVENLDELTDIKVGGDRPKDFENFPTMECQIPVYSNGESQKGLMGYTSVAKIERNCVTVSARGNVGYVCLRRHKFTPIVRLLSVIPKEKIMDELYLYLVLLNSEFISTGAAQQQITSPMLSKMRIVNPTISIREDFYALCNDIYTMVEKLENQNASLAAARDRLLPRLISGKLRV